MKKALSAFFVLGLVLLFTNTAGAVAPSGSGSQEIRDVSDFTVRMWCGGGDPTVQDNAYPSQNLIFGVAATQAPFAQQPFSPTYTDATYACGAVDEVEILSAAGYTGRVQAVVKYSLAGVTLANFTSASLALSVNDYHRTTTSIATAMAVGVYDMQAAQKAIGTVDTTLGTIYPRGTLLDTINVSFTPGQTFTVDVTAAVRSDLTAGRSFSGFILYAQNAREGLEEVAFADPTLTINAIPTLTEWGMLVFAILLIGFALWYMRRRNRISV
jgi:hypothetical protein